jgi:adenylate cyclase
MAETRKLAAILAADVAGYSRLAAADEDRTLARLRALRSDLIDPAIAVHNGRVVKRTGDGILIEFRSVVDAVRCAIEVQNGMVERNAGLPPERQILFRAGVHLGDVVEEADGDLMGDGVNIAARLENICTPGQICLSEPAYWQVKSRLDLAVSDLGDKDLKNIPEPVHVFSLEVGKPAVAKPAVTPARSPDQAGGGAPGKRRMLVPVLAGVAALLLVVIAGGAWFALKPPPGPPPQAGGGRVGAAAAHLSIVVLPFANLSNDPKQDYFADGITDNLTTDLSRIRNSFVIARNTAFTFKGKNVDAKEIGKDLGVRYVLEGSVQRDGNRVRVNAQLIDAESGAHLWADRFEEDLSDLFKLQDDVVARLANTLGHELVMAEAERSAHSANPDAIDLTMQGTALLYRLPPTKQNNDAARTSFAKALEIDPNEAEALAGYAWTYMNDFAFGWGSTGIDYDSKIVVPADRAIALAHSTLLAYFVKSSYLFISHRADEALRVADAGLAINPNYAPLYVARRGAENSLGHFERAKADVQQAMRLSPRDPQIGAFHMALGQTELELGHYETAIDDEHRAIDMGYRPYIPYVILAAADALADRMDDAKTALAEARRLNPNLTVKWVIARAPSVPTQIAGLRKAGLPEDEPAKHLSIVVLPFTNLSGDPKQDYFADGITDNLTTDLSRIRNSFVIARNTAFTFKGKNVDAKEIGKELGVRYVLEGSVQRDGNRVRVNAQLIDAESGAHLWADRFEEDLADLFKLQDNVVARLANALGYELVNAEAAIGARAANPDAIDLTMRGLALLQQENTKDNNSAARTLFELALNVDPNDSDALAGMADTYMHSHAYNWDASSVDYDAKVIGLADRSIALNPANALAYSAKAIYLSQTKRPAEALAVAEAGLEHTPNIVTLYFARAISEMGLARYDQSRSDLLQAIRLSPRHPQLYLYHTLLAGAELLLGHDEATILYARKAIEEGYRGWYAYAYLAASYAFLGRNAEAASALADARRVNPSLTVKWAMAHSADGPRFFEGIRKAGLPEDEGPRLSIVVLPFQNLSGDAKQDYLADVLTDELTTYISRIPGSFVIARNTAFTYKGKPTDVKTIGTDLGVHYALEGSVQPTDKRIRTNAQLIDTETGAHLWAEEFDTDKTDLLQTQDEIVTRLARTLQLQLTDIEAAKLQRSHSDNPDAQDLAWQCQAGLQNTDYIDERAQAAYRFCEKALQADPNNAIAMTLLASKYVLRVSSFQSTDREKDLAQGEALVARALVIEPTNAWADFLQSQILIFRGRFEEANVAAERALRLSPLLIQAYVAQDLIDLYTGQFEKMVECAEKAMRLSPRDSQLFLFQGHLGSAYFALGKDELAIDWLRRSIAAYRNATPTYLYLAAALALHGQAADGHEVLMSYFSLPATRTKTVAALKAQTVSRNPRFLAMRERLYQGLRKAGMPEQ